MATASDTLLILGAGFLGLRVARQWDGPVRAVSRRPAPADLPDHVQWVALDLTTAPDEALAALLDGVTHAVTAYSSTGNPDPRQLHLGLAHRLAAMLPAGLRRLVVVSSTSAIGPVDGVVTEDDAPKPESERGKIQRESEDVLRAACRAAAVPCVILRLAGLYGPGREVARIYRQRSPGPLAGDGNTPTNLIHVDDAVAAVEGALRLDPSVSTTVHVADDDHQTRRAMYVAAAALRGEPPPPFEGPEGTGPPRGKVVSNQKMKSLLGVELRHPHHVLG